MLFNGLFLDNNFFLFTVRFLSRLFLLGELDFRLSIESARLIELAGVVLLDFLICTVIVQLDSGASGTSFKSLDSQLDFGFIECSDGAIGIVL